MEAVILARVSTREQEEGHSIDAQVARLQEYCLRKNLKVLKIFKIIESSTRGERTEFHQMLAFAKNRSETTAIVCDAVDRFQRGFKETVLLEEFRLKGVVELHFSRENLIINRESSGGQILMWNMAVLMANSYVLSLSDNVKRSLNHKIKSGQWIGKAPLGYRNAISATTGKKEVVVDKEKGFLIRRLFEEFAQGGRSCREMVKLAKAWGLVGDKGGVLKSSQIYYILTNPFYYGVMEIKEQIHPANHEPLISKTLFDRCQDIRLGWKKKPFKYSEKPFVFRGLMTCAHCECTITSDLKKGRYVYLACTKSRGPCEGRRIREEKALEKVKETLNGFRIPQTYWKLLRTI